MAICSSPAMITTIMASASVAEWVVRIAAMATVMGAVGPEICERVPPNTAAKNPTAIAL